MIFNLVWDSSPPTLQEVLFVITLLCSLAVVKTECMADWPRVEKFPIAIQFLATYVIVMGVSNHSESIKMETQK